jgi:hypothetical protein
MIPLLIREIYGIGKRREERINFGTLKIDKAREREQRMMNLKGSKDIKKNSFRKYHKLFKITKEQ